MDMHTDTTAHLAAEGAEIPARAATTMRKSRAAGKIAQAPAAVAEDHSTCQDDLRHEVVAVSAAPSLPTLLMQRRAAMIEANWKHEDGDEVAGDAAASEMSRLENLILGSDAVSLDDVIAKLAMVAAHEREGLCFGRDLLYGLALEAQAIFLKSAAPGDALPEHRQGYWMFIETDSVVPPRPVQSRQLAAAQAPATDEQPPREPSAVAMSSKVITAMVESRTPLDDPHLVAAIAIHGENWLDLMLGDKAAPPIALSPEYAARRAEALEIWKLDMGHGGVADYDSEPTGDDYVDACIARVELCRRASEAAFTVLQNTRASSMAELLDKEALLGAYNSEGDKPDWYRADVEALAAGGAPPIADGELVAATEEFFRIDRLQNDTVGAMPSLTPLRDAALEKALTTPASSLVGLKSHLAIVRDWMPAEGAFEPDAYHDNEWRAVRALVDDIERLVVPAASADPKMVQLERLLDQAIADRDFLDGRDHGLSDEEWTARDSIGEDAATAASYLEGDSTELQRLRIKALGWFYRFDVGADPKGFDLEERLAFRLFRSACKAVA